MDRLLSVVVSVYNEEKALEDFYKETTGILKDIDWAYELIFVNDGSSDQSLAILERLSASDRDFDDFQFPKSDWCGAAGNDSDHGLRCFV